jgi:hypothetical protein
MTREILYIMAATQKLHISDALQGEAFGAFLASWMAISSGFGSF